jgi:hypothetical protein
MLLTRVLTKISGFVICAEFCNPSNPSSDPRIRHLGITHQKHLFLARDGLNRTPKREAKRARRCLICFCAVRI